MRAYRLTNNDIVIDVRPHAGAGKQLLRCTKVWCHRREDYCFKPTVTDKAIVRRLNQAETVVAARALGLRMTPAPTEEKPWYEEVRDVIANALP